MLVSSIVVEIKILVIDQILDHFVRHCESEFVHLFNLWGISFYSDLCV
jgi:hypothetical protein